MEGGGGYQYLPMPALYNPSHSRLKITVITDCCCWAEIGLRAVPIYRLAVIRRQLRSFVGVQPDLYTEGNL